MRARVVETLRSMASRVYWASPHFLSHARGAVMILMYHRVLPAGDVASTYVQPGLYVTPEAFERHLAFLREHFEVISFSELLQNWTTGDWDRSARYCVLTFDDGWLDTYEHAFPLLRRYGAPATVFLPTSLIGSRDRFWTDRLADLLRRRGTGRPDAWDAEIERAKQLDDDDRDEWLDRLSADVGETPAGMRQFVDWQEVRAMSRRGIEFGSHSMTHPNLARLDAHALDRELRGSLDALRAHEGVNWVPVLAYPNGDHTETVAAAAHAAGFRAAVTTRPGVETRRPADLYRLARIGLHEDVSRSIPVMTFQIARMVRPWPS